MPALVAMLALALAACGGEGDGAVGDELEANLIQELPGGADVELTVGSKNFTEEIILGEIYAQALEAGGYAVQRRLDLGSERVALRALRSGEIDAYPEYTATALTSFFDIPTDEVPSDAQEAYEASRDDFAELGLTAFPPTPFSSANAVGLLTERADELGVRTISDLAGIAPELILYGSPECRRRGDCLVGLRERYGLRFERFVPVAIPRRYEVLEEGRADLSILFTTDPQLFVSDDFVVLGDDRDVLPAGNVLFVARNEAVEAAGPGFGEIVESVQGNLTLDVMQELNASVDIDGESPGEAAASYLEEFGYIR
jgi:osmoprotectant transport system substrate-binding protein